MDVAMAEEPSSTRAGATTTTTVGFWAHLVGAPAANGFGSSTTGAEVMALHGDQVHGKDVVVTGATSGLGKQVAATLCEQGANVVLAAKERERGERTKQWIVQRVPDANVQAIECDLRSRESIERFAEALRTEKRKVDVLVNNAAVCMCPFRTNEDGVEVQFATNHLGHFHLTNLLLPLLEKGAEKSGSKSRVVNVTCSSHYFHYGENPRFRIHAGIRFKYIGTPFDRMGHTPLYAYGQSKVANILHAVELDRRLQAQGKSVVAVSVNPGFVLSTGIYQYLGWEKGSWQTSLSSWADYCFHGLGTCKTLEQGISSILYCVASPRIEELGGQYFADCNVGMHAKDARDESIAELLWRESERWLGNHSPRVETLCGGTVEDVPNAGELD
mmetsp:Transcript_5783/g.35915  ORF Transcript_5783/g.35915 Transcript_5783/m.35915 type:complete len:387 (+) Transcript_5783:1836-2996(+)